VQGVGVSGIGYVLMTWCIEKRGPVFTASFMPLIQIIAAVLDLFILHEQLYLGRYLDFLICSKKYETTVWLR
jgi:large subunit ribosomal protein L9e